MMLKMMNGGGIDAAHIANPMIKMYKKMFMRISKSLSELAEYKQYWLDTESLPANKSRYSSLVARILNVNEQLILKSFRKAVMEKDVKICSLQFDGLFTSYMTPEIVKCGESCVLSETGYSIKFEEKSLTPTLYYITKLNTKLVKPLPFKESAFDDGENPFIMFDLNVLMDEDTGIIRESFVKSIVTIYKRVGIWTCGKKSRVPLDRLSRLGFKPEIVMGAGQCSIASREYRSAANITDDDEILHMKNAMLHFDRDQIKNHNVIFVDDTPVKYPRNIRDYVVCAKTWASNISSVDDDDILLSSINDKACKFKYMLLPKVITYEKEQMQSRLDEFGKQQYNINPIISETQCTIISSGMFTGKTFAADALLSKDMGGLSPQLEKILNNKEFMGQFKNVLICTVRVQHGHSTMASFKTHGFSLYSEHSDLSDKNGVVGQFESIHKLAYSKRWDLVICDEVHSLGAQMVSYKTNKGNLQVNNRLLKFFMQNAKVLLMDADIEVDGLVKDFVLDVFPRDQIVLHRYKHSNLERTFNIHSEKHTFMKELEKCLIAREKVMLCFRSRSELQRVMTMLDELAKRPLNVMEFTSKSSAEHMKKFTNIDIYVGDLDVCAFTSKVTVAADIKVPFSKVFCFANSRYIYQYRSPTSELFFKITSEKLQ